MNILVLAGSPHGRNGDSGALARLVLERLAGGTRWLDVYSLAIAPCRGCGACLATGDCVLDAGDDMGVVVAGLRWCDVLLVASPLHFSSLSGPLICCFGRLQRFWKSGGLGGKARRGGLAVAGGSEYGNMFDPARRVAAALFATLGVEWRGMATASGTDRIAAADNPAAREQAAALAAALKTPRSPNPSAAS